MFVAVVRMATPSMHPMIAEIAVHTCCSSMRNTILPTVTIMAATFTATHLLCPSVANTVPVADPTHCAHYEL